MFTTHYKLHFQGFYKILLSCCLLCMPINLVQLLLHSYPTILLNFSVCKESPFLMFTLLYIHQWWTFVLILRDGDVHPHPGPPRNLLKIKHWNLNSIIAHDGIRVPLIQSFNLIQNYDLIAITETALNESTSNETIQLEGYTPIRKDLPSGTSHGGVMFYHKDSLPVIRRPDLETQENSLVCEVSINKKQLLQQLHTGVTIMVM